MSMASVKSHRTSPGQYYLCSHFTDETQEHSVIRPSHKDINPDLADSRVRDLSVGDMGLPYELPHSSHPDLWPHRG